MALDIYSTATLNGVVDNMKRASAAMIERFFTTVIVSDKEKIYFDIAEGKRRIAPFVHPTSEGRVVQGLGYETRDFQPAYVKDLRIFRPNRALRRTIGETIGGSMKPRDRVKANLVFELADQQSMRLLREEVMATEALRTGKVTVTGDGYDTVVVDFKRDPALSITLAGASRWGQAGISPVTNLEDWTELMLKIEGAVASDVVMTLDSWRLFKVDPEFTDRIDLRRSNQDAVNLSSMAKLGLAYKGMLDGVAIWVYVNWYVNEADVEVSVLPPFTVMVLSRSVEGVRYYGAILDEDAGMRAVESYSKSWTVPNPSVRYLLTQSAPLPTLHRANGSMGITVA